ncbi:MAG: twin-arginine translocation signal domain-containing protein [Alteraurantiacibacter sp.]
MTDGKPDTLNRRQLLTAGAAATGALPLYAHWRRTRWVSR